MKLPRWTPVPVVALCLAGAAAGATGAATGESGRDEPPFACTQIGCSSGVHVRFDRLPAAAHTARVCVDGRCGRAQKLWRAPDGDRLLFARLPKAKRRAGASVGVRLVLLDREGRVLSRSRTRARVRRYTPNGAGCPPTCFTVGLRYRGASGRLES